MIINNSLFHSSKCPGFNDELYVLPAYVASLVAQSKETACNAGDQGLIPGSGRSPGEGNCNPVFLHGVFYGQRSLAGNSLWGHKGSDMTQRLTHIIVSNF